MIPPLVAHFSPFAMLKSRRARDKQLARGKSKDRSDRPTPLSAGLPAWLDRNVREALDMFADELSAHRYLDRVLWPNGACWTCDKGKAGGEYCHALASLALIRS